MDRSSKATLPLTVPRSGLSRLQMILLPERLSVLASTYALGVSPISSLRSPERDSAASSRDSDLEAFSHNPTHGSFAPPAGRPSAMTNYANQRFLSY